MANAFACRSASQWPGRLGWFTNHFLVLAVAAEAGMLAAFLYVRPLASLLNHAAPSARGYLVAATAVPCVLIADAIQKRQRRKQASLGD